MNKKPKSLLSNTIMFNKIINKLNNNHEKHC